MSPEIQQHLISVFFIWSYKIITIIVGYYFAKLGYNLLIKGVTGEFKFSAQYKGVKADLISASPGIFFILMGAIIVGIGLYKGMNIETTPIKKNEINTPIKDTLNKPKLRIN